MIKCEKRYYAVAVTASMKEEGEDKRYYVYIRLNPEGYFNKYGTFCDYVVMEKDLPNHIPSMTSDEYIINYLEGLGLEMTKPFTFAKIVDSKEQGDEFIGTVLQGCDYFIKPSEGEAFVDFNFTEDVMAIGEYIVHKDRR